MTDHDIPSRVPYTRCVRCSAVVVVIDDEATRMVKICSDCQQREARLLKHVFIVCGVLFSALLIALLLQFFFPRNPVVKPEGDRHAEP